MNVCNLSNNSTVWHGRDVPSYFQFSNKILSLSSARSLRSPHVMWSS